MSIPSKALELENRSLNKEGDEPALLAAAYDVLKREWNNGNRDRELALHLMFLAWYGLCEPPFITGFEMQDGINYILKDGLISELQRTFQQVHLYFQPAISKDPEMLYVVGLMAHLFPYMLGNNEEWESRSIEYRKLYRAKLPDGISPLVFNERGVYGKYFQGQAAIKNGY